MSKIHNSSSMYCVDTPHSERDICMYILCVNLTYLYTYITHNHLASNKAYIVVVVGGFKESYEYRRT